MSPRRLVGLYPAAWRDRYGEEFLALLEESRPTGIALVDIAWGAVDAHLFPQAPEGRFRMFTRLAGLAALGVGLILVLGALNIGFGNPEQNAIRVSAIYTLACIGLVGIHLRQVAVRPALAWLGFVACALGLGTGAITFALGLAGALPPSSGEAGFHADIALWLGTAVLGGTMLAIGLFPWPVGLAFAVGAPLAMIGLAISLTATPPATLEFLALTGIVLNGLGWFGAGLSLLAAQPRGGVLTPQT